MHALTHDQSGNSRSSVEPRSNTAEQRGARRKLPPIGLPHFSGKYSDTYWTSFKDLFISLVDRHEDLTDVERLYYLKTSLSGEAANAIKNIPVTKDNYERAWARFISHYDNKRIFIHSCLDRLFQLSAVKSESPQALKQLRDGTLEAIETLEVFGRPVKQMDDLLCYLTVQRLDSRTRRDWELTLGDSSTPVTWQQLDSFLQTRI